MNRLKSASRRVRPLLGTFVEITIFSEGDLNGVITKAFEVGNFLEKIFNLKDPESEISLFNRFSKRNDKSCSDPFKEVMEFANQLNHLSQGAFNAQFGNDQHWDLNGIAKGYIVDKMVETILQNDASLKGVINAGGDLRFFNCSERPITLRLGTYEAPVLRTLVLTKNALATSSLSVSRSDPKSSTHYEQSLRKGLDLQSSVSVLADECMIADGLTKVGLFAKKDILEKCAFIFSAQVVIFDGKGETVEVI
ncbi:MAG: FAD:protein FMN transferase [Pseudobdellovibrionaceae bacterium]